jgi:hypothetical protein
MNKSRKTHFFTFAIAKIYNTRMPHLRFLTFIFSLSLLFASCVHIVRSDEQVVSTSLIDSLTFTLDSLKSVNESLSMELSEKQDASKRQLYAVGTIVFTFCQRSGVLVRDCDLTKSVLVRSEITEIPYSRVEEEKYRILEALEAKLEICETIDCSMTRDCYFFETYEEASRFRNDLKYKE